MQWIVLAFVAVIIVLAVFLVWSCADIASGIWLKTVCRGLEDHAVLGFDDGPDPDSTGRILDILARYEVKACFFVTGERARKYPGLIRRMVEEGHIVGNHTYHHSSIFPLAGVPCMVSELSACDSAIVAALDGSSVSQYKVRYFRPPFGVTNPDVAKAVKRTGHIAVGWDVRSFDTVLIRDGIPENKAGEAVRRCAERVLGKLTPESVVLLHDRLKYSPLLLECILRERAALFRGQPADLPPSC